MRDGSGFVAHGREQLGGHRANGGVLVFARAAGWPRAAPVLAQLGESRPGADGGRAQLDVGLRLGLGFVAVEGGQLGLRARRSPGRGGRRHGPRGFGFRRGRRGRAVRRGRRRRGRAREGGGAPGARDVGGLLVAGLLGRFGDFSVDFSVEASVEVSADFSTDCSTDFSADASAGATVGGHRRARGPARGASAGRCCCARVCPRRAGRGRRWCRSCPRWRPAASRATGSRAGETRPARPATTVFRRRLPGPESDSDIVDHAEQPRQTSPAPSRACVTGDASAMRLKMPTTPPSSPNSGARRGPARRPRRRTRGTPGTSVRMACQVACRWPRRGDLAGEDTGHGLGERAVGPGAHRAGDVQHHERVGRAGLLEQTEGQIRGLRTQHDQPTEGGGRGGDHRRRGGVGDGRQHPGNVQHDGPLRGAGRLQGLAVRQAVQLGEVDRPAVAEDPRPTPRRACPAGSTSTKL